MSWLTFAGGRIGGRGFLESPSQVTTAQPDLTSGATPNTFKPSRVTAPAELEVIIPVKSGSGVGAPEESHMTARITSPMSRNHPTYFVAPPSMSWILPDIEPVGSVNIPGIVPDPPTGWGWPVVVPDPTYSPPQCAPLPLTALGNTSTFRSWFGMKSCIGGGIGTLPGQAIGTRLVIEPRALPMTTEPSALTARALEGASMTSAGSG